MPSMRAVPEKRQKSALVRVEELRAEFEHSEQPTPSSLWPSSGARSLHGRPISTASEIPIQNLRSIGGESPLLKDSRQVGLTQPAVPGDLVRVRHDSPRNDGIAHPKPVRAQPASVKELEPEAHCRRHPQFLVQLTGGCLLIRLPDSQGSTDSDLVMPRESGHLLSTPMDEDPTLPVVTHDHGNPVQPALPDGVSPTHWPQHTVLCIDTFHDFVHEAHDRRAH